MCASRFAWRPLWPDAATRRRQARHGGRRVEDTPRDEAGARQGAAGGGWGPAGTSWYDTHSSFPFPVVDSRRPLRLQTEVALLTSMSPRPVVDGQTTLCTHLAAALNPARGIPLSADEQETEPYHIASEEYKRTEQQKGCSSSLHSRQSRLERANHGDNVQCERCYRPVALVLGQPTSSSPWGQSRLPSHFWSAQM